MNLEKQALQAQMNPHFIFNCLNSVQNFIMDNEKESAMEYLSTFAILIRKNLKASVDSQILVSDEVEMLNIYLDLEKLRFNNKFDYDIIIDRELLNSTLNIPPMLIQPYVENAIVHGMNGIEYKGLITIAFVQYGKEIKVTIQDNGIGISSTKKVLSHKSLGMSITQQRLAHNQKLESIPIEIESSNKGTTIILSILPIGS